MEHKTPTVEECFALATMELRRYGFRCDLPQDSKNKHGEHKRSFATEPATGMAALTQREVDASISVDPPQKDGPETVRCVSVRVGYTHHSGGGNGVTLDARVWRDYLGREPRIVWDHERRRSDDLINHYEIWRNTNKQEPVKV